MKNLSFLILLFTLLCFKDSAASTPDYVKEGVCATCKGKANCNACKTCNYCAHCNAGGTCGICSSAPSSNKPAVRPVYKAPVQQDNSQCKGTTKKGQRCKRIVKGGGNCWQH